MNQLSDLAYSIWVDYLEKSSDTDPAKIGSWIFSNVGRFNVYTNSKFSIANNTFSPEIGNEEAAIFAQMYLIKYYDMLCRRALRGLLSSDGESTTNINWISAKDDNSSFTRANPNETAKVFSSAKKDAQEALDGLLRNYIFYNATPTQIAGDE